MWVALNQQEIVKLKDTERGEAKVVYYPGQNGSKVFLADLKEKALQVGKVLPGKQH